jgi:hypothetical protein
MITANEPTNSVITNNSSFTKNSVSGCMVSTDSGRREGKLYAATDSNIELPAVQRDHFVGSSSTNFVYQFMINPNVK